MSDRELIPMKVVETFGKWFPKMTAGFTPGQAKEIFAKKLAVYVNAEDGPTSFDQEVPAVSVKAEQTEPAIVAIPDDWDQQHHMKIIALAKSIAGDAAPTPLTLEAAKSIIADELAQRAETKGT